MDVFLPLREKMVREQILSRGIKNPQVIKALRKVPRHEFVALPYQKDAYADYPLPTASGQTISQPYMVALMTELLELYGDETVLEIGTGSGYQTAVLAELVQTVYSVERIDTLSLQADLTLQRLGYSNVKLHVGDGTLGWEEFAPYDRIIVTASAPNLPQPLADQLKESGKMVIPLGANLGQDLIVAEKQKGRIKLFDYGKCVFVPLVGEFGWPASTG
jgi:protein-L-isoaspartate(D-aspartate) O-methyltransferase